MEAYDITTMKVENAEMIIKGLTLHWLNQHRQPECIVADSAKLPGAGIELFYPAEKEGWAPWWSTRLKM